MNDETELKPIDRRMTLGVSMMLMAAFGHFPVDPDMSYRVARRSSRAKRYDPARAKTEEDVERIEAAQRKRERKAAKKSKSIEPLVSVVLPDGAFYGRVKGVKCECGGQLRIDGDDDCEDDDFRFQVFCDRCRTCDPNGYPNSEAIIGGIASFWQNGEI